MLSPSETQDLKLLAAQIRLLTMQQICARGFGHAGGALSVADLLAVLYGKVMRLKPEEPEWTGRDFLICSKGHAGPAVYAALCLRGFFPADWLPTLNRLHTRLPSHCDRLLTPGVDMTTGSLGQGFSIAAGLALGLGLRGRQNQVYTLIGDGELDEGQVWETAMFAAYRQLGQLIAFCDWNKRQLDGDTAHVLAIPNIAERFAAFGWQVRVVDGQNVQALAETIVAMQGGLCGRDTPRLIVLDTVKGAGVTEIEQMTANHHVTMARDLGERILDRLEEQVQVLRQERDEHG